MKLVTWSKQKNIKLKIERGVSFQQVQTVLETKKGLLDVIDHPNKNKYPQQRMFIVSINNYVYLIPFVEDDDKIFLKTIIPSRKATREYLITNKENA